MGILPMPHRHRTLELETRHRLCRRARRAARTRVRSVRKRRPPNARTSTRFIGVWSRVSRTTRFTCSTPTASSGRGTRARRARRGIAGYRAEEIIGRHYACFYSVEERMADAPHRNLEIARTKGKYEAEGWRYRKDGSKFWAHVVIDALRDQNGKLFGFAKITRDCTEQRQTSLALEETTRNLDLALDNMSQGLCLFNRRGRLVLSNNQFARILLSISDETLTAGMALSTVLRRVCERAGMSRDQNRAMRAESAQEARASLRAGPAAGDDGSRASGPQHRGRHALPVARRLGMGIDDRGRDRAARRRAAHQSPRASRSSDGPAQSHQFSGAAQRSGRPGVGRASIRSRCSISISTALRSSTIRSVIRSLRRRRTAQGGGTQAVVRAAFGRSARAPERRRIHHSAGFAPSSRRCRGARAAMHPEALRAIRNRGQRDHHRRERGYRLAERRMRRCADHAATGGSRIVQSQTRGMQLLSRL